MLDKRCLNEYSVDFRLVGGQPGPFVHQQEHLPRGNQVLFLMYSNTHLKPCGGWVRVWTEWSLCPPAASPPGQQGPSKNSLSTSALQQPLCSVGFVSRGFQIGGGSLSIIVHLSTLLPRAILCSFFECAQNPLTWSRVFFFVLFNGSVRVWAELSLCCPSPQSLPMHCNGEQGPCKNSSTSVKPIKILSMLFSWYFLATLNDI